MNRLFIEARHEKTSECCFLKTLANKYFQAKEIDFVFMDGCGNLFREPIVNQLKSSEDNGDNCLVLLDADTSDKGGGFARKAKWVMDNKSEVGVSFSFFIYPNDSDDGDIECLMEQVARRDLHEGWFDCFEDYEKCVKGMKDSRGMIRYNIPNRKGKLHTYISSMNLSAARKQRLGNGDWLFEQPEYWDLESISLKPLLNFLEDNLM